MSDGHPPEREVAGIRCGGVLALLGDYVDGGLGPAAVAQVEAHLRGCDWCTRFGTSYAETVAELRRQLADPEPVPAGVRRGLAARLLAVVDQD